MDECSPSASYRLASYRLHQLLSFSFPKDGRGYFRDTLGSLPVHSRSLDACERGCSEGVPRVNRR